jgi:hypothetical protein
MMSVVVDHVDAVRAPLELEAAIHATKILQCLADGIRCDVETYSDGDCRGGVQDVVLAGT